MSNVSATTLKLVIEQLRQLSTKYRLFKVAYTAETKSRCLAESIVHVRDIDNHSKGSDDAAVLYAAQEAKDVLRLLNGERLMKDYKGYYTIWTR